MKESQVKKIYVGNFSFSMKEPELRSLFEPYGTIESVTVATDRDSGRSRGFGFVSMPNDDEAEKAMAALNGKDSGGRALTVNEARPQTQRSGFRDGGRGGDRNSRRSW
jgi:cold-inducible RNA-binding protein